MVAKKRVKKRAVSSKKSISRSSKNSGSNWVFASVSIALFVIAVFALGYVNVSGNTVVNIIQSGSGNIYVCSDGSQSSNPADCADKSVTTSSGGSSSSSSNFFDQWASGNVDTVFAKYLLLLILTLLIFSSLNFARFPNNTGLQWLISIPVAFLFTAYIAPAEIFAMLTAYTAAGLTLGVIIPFVVLLFFSAMLLSNERIRGMTIGKIIVEVALWLLFIGFLVYKLIAGLSDGSMSKGVAIIMLVVLGLSLFIFAFNRWFRNWTRRLGHEIRGARAEAAGVEHNIRAREARESERDYNRPFSD